MNEIDAVVCGKSHRVIIRFRRLSISDPHGKFVFKDRLDFNGPIAQAFGLGQIMAGQPGQVLAGYGVVEKGSIRLRAVPYDAGKPRETWIVSPSRGPLSIHGNHVSARGLFQIFTPYGIFCP